MRGKIQESCNMSNLKKYEQNTSKKSTKIRNIFRNKKNQFITSL